MFILLIASRPLCLIRKRNHVAGVEIVIMHVTRPRNIYNAMDLRCGVLKRPQRNVSESASAKYEEENKEWNDGMGGVYLARYVGYVNVIIHRFSRESSRTLAQKKGRDRNECTSEKRFFKIWIDHMVGKSERAYFRIALRIFLLDANILSENILENVNILALVYKSWLNNSDESGYIIGDNFFNNKW